MDNGLSGALIEPSSYFKKSPPVQYTDDVARLMTEDFITKYGWKTVDKKKSAKKPRKTAAKKTAKKAKKATKPAKKAARPKAKTTRRVVRKKK